jgi:hypothetical protein
MLTTTDSSVPGSVAEWHMLLPQKECTCGFESHQGHLRFRFALGYRTWHNIFMPYTDIEKQKAAQRASYERNKVAVLERSKWYRRENLRKINEIKSNPCTDCGESYPYYVMQFDHIGDDKSADVSRLLRTRGWPAIEEEIAKCELVCANCHAIRTWKRTQTHGI